MKIVGNKKTGVKDLKSVLNLISKNYHLTITEGGNYAVDDSSEEGFMETFCYFDEKYAEYIYDNDDLEYYEQERIVEAIPDKPRFPLKDYLDNKDLQAFIDSLLDFGFFVLKADSKTKELYLLYNPEY